MQLRLGDKFPSFLLLKGYDQPALQEVAKRLAQILLCDVGVGCGTCFACRKVGQNSHEELLVLDAFAADADPKGSYRLEAANALKDHLSLHGLGGGARVALLIEAAALNVQAVNRLLKTLEELPSHAFVIMTTTRPLDVPETLRGRAVSWVFRPEASTLTPAGVLGQENQADLEALLLGDRSLAERLVVAERLAKSKTVDFASLLEGIELILHSDLASRHQGRRDDGLVGGTGGWDGATRSRLRDELSQLRRLAVRGKISLNFQLALESLAATAMGFRSGAG